MSLFAAYEPGARGPSPPADLTTRPAEDRDLPALAALRVERDGWTLEAATASFAGLLEAARGGTPLALVAETDGLVVGYGVADWFAHTTIPRGWYLAGLIVAPAHRRRGIAARLTRERLAWIAARSAEAWYFANARNRATIDLHARLGFVEVARGIAVPGVTFEGGVGLLFRADLASRAPGADEPTTSESSTSYVPSPDDSRSEGAPAAPSGRAHEGQP